MWLATLSVISVLTYPEIRRLSQLRRDPHMLGLFRWLCELRPSIGNPTRRQRLLCLRRLLNDLADQGHHLQPGLIIREDFPALPEYLPRPLSPDDDRRLQDELRRKDDLYSNALLLTRLTGIRIGECIHLPLDCLRQLGPEQWALHVPLGKLHTERLVPLDSQGLRLLKRILELRAAASPGRLSKIQGLSPPSSRRPLCLVSNAAFGAGRCRQTGGLHRYETYLPPPSEAHLGHGTTQLRDWAPRPHEVDGPQKYPDDPPLFEGCTARLTTRILPGTPKSSPDIQPSLAFRLHGYSRSAWHPPGGRGHPPSVGDVPTAVLRRQDPPPSTAARSPAPGYRSTPPAHRSAGKVRKYWPVNRLACARRDSCYRVHS